MIARKQARKRQVGVGVQLSRLQYNQYGFTIIESLVAIVVAGILLAAIAPVFVLSVGVRVQARRVELATQAAKAYIDGVKAQSIVPPVSTGTDTLQASAPTAGTLTCRANSYCTAPSTTNSSLYCVDFNGSGICDNTSSKYMIVQAFRYNSISSDTTKGYTLGIRVYRADAFKGTGTLKKTADNPLQNGTQSTFTGNLISPSTMPLLETTAEINNTVPQYSDLCNRIGNGGCTN